MSIMSIGVSKRVGLVAAVAAVLLVALIVAIVRSELGSRPPTVSSPGSYEDQTYGYKVTLPPSWHVETSADDAQTRVFSLYDKGEFAVIGIDLNCYSNPQQLDPKAFWQDRQGAGGSAPNGTNVSLSSGLPAYKSLDQGQLPYEIYTVTQGKKACQIVVYNVGEPDYSAAETAADTFQWR